MFLQTIEITQGFPIYLLSWNDFKQDNHLKEKEMV